MTETSRYPVQVFWSEDDAGFIAIAPDLPGCSAFGVTQDAALFELRDAIHAWLEASAKAGRHIPQPSAPTTAHSGKFALRMPVSLHARLAHEADREGISLNQYINVLLAAEHERRVFETARAIVFYTASSGSPDASLNQASILTGRGRSVLGAVTFEPPLRASTVPLRESA